MAANPIYLDYNATTPIDPAVAEAITASLSGGPAGTYGNPSSSHFAGKSAGAALAKARQQVADLIHAEDPSTVLFESCASESVNHIIKSLLYGDGTTFHLRGRHIVTSEIEHIVVLEVCRWAVAHLGASLTYVSPQADGRLRAEDVVKALRSDTFLVSIMHANNETGAVNDLQAITTTCAAHSSQAEAQAQAGAAHSSAAELPRLPLLFHTDCSQSLGKIPVSVQSMGVHFATFAGHKLYAPKGIGVTYMAGHQRLALPSPLALPPLLHGAGQEGGRRAGTENTHFAIGLGCAAALCAEKLKGNAESLRLAALRDRLAVQLKKGAAAAGLSVTVNGPLESWFASLDPSAPIPSSEPQADAFTCLPNTLSIAFPPSFAVHVLHALRHTVAASAGAACHSAHVGSMEHAHVSHVLQAMKRARDVMLSTMRLTVGRWTTEQEIDEAATRILAAVQEDVSKRVGPVLSPPPPAAAPTAPIVLASQALFHGDTYLYSCTSSVLALAEMRSEGGTPARPAVTAACATGGGPAITAGTILGPAVADGAEPASHVLVLDATVAHPQGGGQPSDHGCIFLSLPLPSDTTGADWGSSTATAVFRFTAVRWGATSDAVDCSRAVLHYGRFVQPPTLPPSTLERSDVEAFVETTCSSTAEASARGSGAAHWPAASASVLQTLASAVHSGKAVPCTIAISSSYRQLCARLHSAGHLLDEAVRATYPGLFPGGTPPPSAPQAMKPGKGYHFLDGPWVEYDTALPAEVRDSFVGAVNAAIAQLVGSDAATAVHTLTRAHEQELISLGIDPVADLGHLSATVPVRIVCVGGARNACPCGGTHVRSAGQLKGLNVTKIKVQKGKTKVSYTLDG